MYYKRDKREEECMANSITNIDISLNHPNKETIDALLEAEGIAKDPSVKGYTDLDKLFTDLKA